MDSTSAGFKKEVPRLQLPTLEGRIDWLERQLVDQRDELFRLKDAIRKHQHAKNGQTLIPLNI